MLKKSKDIMISAKARKSTLPGFSEIIRGEIAPAENQAAATVFKKSDKPLI